MSGTSPNSMQPRSAVGRNNRGALHRSSVADRSGAFPEPLAACRTSKPRDILSWCDALRLSHPTRSAHFPTAIPATLTMRANRSVSARM